MRFAFFMPVDSNLNPALLLLLLLHLLVIPQVSFSSQGYNTSAHFRVMMETVNADLQPFTATIGGIGNTLVRHGAGFEPVIFRNKYIVTEDASDRVVAEPSLISHWDTLREGALDGAEVRVYRVENGRMRLVREDRVAEGGFHASGWKQVTREGMVVPGDSHQYIFRWDPWERPGAEYYFSVRAIDHSGNYSAPAKALMVRSPKKLTDGQVDNKEIEYRESKLTLDSTAPAAPTNLRGSLGSTGSLTLVWDAPSETDVAGYVVLRSDYPPERHKGHYLQLAGKPANPDQYVRIGDMVIVSKKFYTVSRKRYFTNRIWSAYNETEVLRQQMVDIFSDEESGKRTWELVKHELGTPVDEPGETYLQVKLARGQEASVELYNHSGTGQDWYDVLEKGKKYKMEVWLRKEGMGRIKFNSDGSLDGITPEYLRAGDDWGKYSTTFTPRGTDKGETPYLMRLELSGPGVFSIDNFRIYQADSDYLDLLPGDYQRLRDSGMTALRTHSLVRTGRRSYDLEQLTNSGGVITCTDRLNTLPQLLAIMHKAGVRPWLQIEPHLSPQEWLGLIEYLAAPYDPVRDTPSAKPWAHKRYDQGQQRPWVEVFDKIYLELGNETWNSLFAPWVFDGMPDQETGRNYDPGEVYGLYQEYVISILRSSPYWQAAKLDDKFKFVIGGWNGLDYGRQATSMSPSSTYLTIAAYNGGWDEAEGPPKLNAESLFYVLNQTSQSAIPTAEWMAEEAQGIHRSGGPILLGTYEAGPGYVLNGLNGDVVTPQQAAEQELVMKGLAAGTATLDAFLARAYRGFRLQNYFTFGAGTYWTSHAKWYKGGQAYPSWQLLALFNREGTGDMLRTEALSVPSAPLIKFGRRQSVAAAPLVSVYATAKGDRFNLFVLSRKVGGYPEKRDGGFTPVTVDLPFTSAGKLTLYRMAGDPGANNVDGEHVKVEKVPLSAQGVGGRLTLSPENGADNKGLPPAATYLYVFEGFHPG